VTWIFTAIKNAAKQIMRITISFLYFLVPFLHRAQQWTERVGMPCDAETASRLFRQYVCSLPFSESDFTVGDGRRLNRLAVPNPFTVASHSNSTQQHGGPSLNSSSYEEDLHVLVPTRTYSKKSITSLTKEPIYIHSDISLPLLIYPDMSLPAETSTSLKEDTSFPLGSADEIASGGELQSVNLQSSLPKHKAQHFYIKELGLDRGI
jgi:hypothetical protein